MSDQKMSLIEQLDNPPRIAGGHLDEDQVVDLMRIAALALSTMIGVAAKATAASPVGSGFDQWLAVIDPYRVMPIETAERLYEKERSGNV